ncbi:MAG: universal stress protein [Myxococcales bacterium]|nr:universal stress protein [Myxococcales bacterium]
MSRIQKILCPVDFSAGSAQALQQAVDLARRLGASVQVLHTYEMPRFKVPAGFAAESGEPGEPFDFKKAVDSELDEHLSELRQKVDSERVPLSTRLIQGPPAATIVDHASSQGFDLIVMGSHGRSGLDRLLLGSVTERVLRLSRCPVLTVHVAA